MNEQGGLEINCEGGVAVAAFKGASVTDIGQISSAASQIKKFIEENHPKRLVFDFEQVKFFSSQVLGLLLDARARLELCRGEVVISSINPQLYRVFRITNLDRIFRFFPDKQSALADYAQK